MPQLSLHSPIGDLTLSEEEGHIVSLDSGWGRDQAPTPLLLRASRALQDYFDGDPMPFDLPLDPPGTPFQRRAWSMLQTVPRGQSWSYGDLARRLGSVARAVGQVCARNPIPILIPCHRVHSATGPAEHYSFADGASTKAWLMSLERRNPGAPSHQADPSASGALLR